MFGTEISIGTYCKCPHTTFFPPVRRDKTYIITQNISDDKKLGEYILPRIVHGINISVRNCRSCGRDKSNYIINNKLQGVDMNKIEATLKVLCSCTDLNNPKIMPSVITSSLAITDAIAADPIALGQWLNQNIERIRTKVNTECVECKKRRIKFLASLGTSDEGGV